MIILLGEENYLKEQYLQSFRPMPIRIYPKNIRQLEEAVAEANNVSIFSAPVAIFLNGYRGDLEPLLKICNPEIFLIADSLDKRTKVYKTLVKKGDVKEFNPLVGQALKGFIQDLFRKEGKKVSPDVIEYFSLMCGNNLFLIDNEVKKLCLYCLGRNITLADAEKTVLAYQKHIFEAVDVLVEKKYYPIRKDNAYQILYMSIKQLRLVAQVKDLLNQGNSPAQIKSVIRQHPFVIEKAIKQAEKIKDPVGDLAQLNQVEIEARETGDIILSLNRYLWK